MCEQEFSSRDQEALTEAIAHLDGAQAVRAPDGSVVPSVGLLLDAALPLLTYARGEDFTRWAPQTIRETPTAPSAEWRDRVIGALSLSLTSLGKLDGLLNYGIMQHHPARLRAAARARTMLTAARDHLVKYAYASQSARSVAEDLFTIRGIRMRIEALRDRGLSGEARAECLVVFSAYRDLVRVFPDLDLRREYLSIVLVYCEILVEQDRKEYAINLLTLVAHRCESDPALSDLAEVAVREGGRLTHPGETGYWDPYEYLFEPQVLESSQMVGIVHAPWSLYTDEESSDVLEELIRMGIVDEDQDEPSSH